MEDDNLIPAAEQLVPTDFKLVKHENEAHANDLENQMSNEELQLKEAAPRHKSERRPSNNTLEAETLGAQPEENESNTHMHTPNKPIRQMCVYETKEGLRMEARVDGCILYVNVSGRLSMKFQIPLLANKVSFNPLEMIADSDVREAEVEPSPKTADHSMPTLQAIYNRLSLHPPQHWTREQKLRLYKAQLDYVTNQIQRRARLLGRVAGSVKSHRDRLKELGLNDSADALGLLYTYFPDAMADVLPYAQTHADTEANMSFENDVDIGDILVAAEKWGYDESPSLQCDRLLL